MWKKGTKLTYLFWLFTCKNALVDELCICCRVNHFRFGKKARNVSISSMKNCRRAWALFRLILKKKNYVVMVGRIWLKSYKNWTQNNVLVSTFSICFNRFGTESLHVGMLLNTNSTIWRKKKMMKRKKNFNIR